MIFEIFLACAVSSCILYVVLICILDCDLRLAFYEKFGKSLHSLEQKVIFITGASSGIGEETAMTLAKHGCKLVLAARRLDELERVRKNCIVFVAVSGSKLKAEDILIIQMDVTHFKCHKDNFFKAVDHFGKVDILFNNAGRSQRAYFEDIEICVDSQIFDLNVFAAVNLSRVAVNYFKTVGRGQIAVNSSIAGIIGLPFSCTYTATKHALHGYFNSLRAETIGKGISVNIFCPGPTFTNFLAECFTEKEGKKYGISAKSTDRRMSAKRCAELCVIGLSNNIGESWMGLYPTLPLCYMFVYFPFIYNMALNTLGPERFFKMRDSKEKTISIEHNGTR